MDIIHYFPIFYIIRDELINWKIYNINKLGDSETLKPYKKTMCVMWQTASNCLASKFYYLWLENDFLFIS